MMLTDYIDRGARCAPDAPCMMAPDGEVFCTHAEFQALTHRIAAALLDDGLQIGDRVAVFSPNDPLAFAAVVGVLRAGGTWVAINYASREEELADFLTLTGCTRLVYHGTLGDRARVLLDRVDAIKLAVSIGAADLGHPALADWMAAEGTTVADPPEDHERPAMLMGTGGTTGKPKGVPLSHRQLHLMSIAFNAHLAEPEPPRYICATPMTHAGGGAAFCVMAEGGFVIVHQGVKAPDILDSLERNRVSRIFLPPSAVYAVMGHESARGRDYSALRHFLISASPIAPERLAEAVDVFGPVVVQVFGQSESPFICTVLAPSVIAAAAAADDEAGRRRLASCGRPSIVARVEIMDDDGTLLGPEEAGEIVIKSDLVFAGYWNDPAATEDTRRPGGWHATGDLGVRDKDGFVYIIDRKKDMIITGGFNVFPSEIEAVIHTFATVSDCAVIGLPDEKWGESVTAVVEPKDGADIDADAIIATCKERLGSVKAPKRVIVRDLPRSPVGKVLKRELRDEFWTGSARRV